MSSQAPQYEIDITDVEYYRHGDRALLARLYRPRTDKPLPMMIDIHGGVWCRLDRTQDAAICKPLAQSGIVMVSLDFRMPPEARYPASLQDINCGVRWFKAHAARFGIDASRVGILGCSSGGHQAMLTALLPDDPRYAALSFAGAEGVDASVQCAVLCWPVIDPLGRFHYVLELKKKGGSHYADHALPSHYAYWPDELAMAEASPLLIMERGQPVHTPRVLYLQGTADGAHPRPLMERFIDAYGKRGGQLEHHMFEGVGEAFINATPDAPASVAAVQRIVAFARRALAAA